VVARDVHGGLPIDARDGLDLCAWNRVLQRCNERVVVHYESFCSAIFRWSWTMP
jgi:hypothetical protein